MKTLSLRAAKRCENSEHTRCRCRCGGVLHGAKRGLDETYFFNLPEDDPHKANERKAKPPKPPKRQMYLWEIFQTE